MLKKNKDKATVLSLDFSSKFSGTGKLATVEIGSEGRKKYHCNQFEPEGENF